MSGCVMNAERLLEVYEQISEAPDAIERLRHFVLDLAVRGKLVEQDAGDEPAYTLMRAAKALQAEEGVTVKTDLLQPGETPFPAPLGWLWTRVGLIAVQTGSGSTPRGGKSAYADEGTPFLRSQNIYDDGLRLDDVVFINDETNQKMKRTQVKAKDLLLNITGGSIGRCTRVPDEFAGANVSQHVAIIRTAAPGTEDYLHLLIRSPFFQDYVVGEQTGAGRGGLPKNRMDRIPVPLPPLAEQHRIVAKVDELMALCDRLEEARKTREELRDKLTAASLARLTAPETTAQAEPAKVGNGFASGSATSEDDFPTHAAFALEALPALTTRPDQIKTLRQTILNLAVRGKLVEQDPTDEPAEKLEAEVLKALGGKPSNLSSITHSDLPCLPAGWVHSRVDRLTTVGTGVTPSKGESKYHVGGTVPWVNSAATNKPEIRSATHFVTEVAVSECRLKLYPPGSLVVALYGQGKTRGQVSKLLIPATVNQACAVLQFPESFQSIRPYIFLTLQQQYEAMRAMAEGGAQPNLNLGKIKSRGIALPPLEEQHRIVAKVDALMALCDRLEAALTTTDTTRTRLLEALLHEALEPADKVLEVAE